MILATYLNNVSKFGIFFLNFGQIMAIENLKRHMILALLIFNLAIYGQWETRLLWDDPHGGRTQIAKD
jgi:hypothetical protein